MAISERALVEDLDPLAPETNPPGVLERLEDATHDLAPRPDFIGQCLMRGLDRVRVLKEARREALGDPSKREVIDQRHQLGHPSREGVEHEGSKRR
jgi:hypothetical protein